LEKITLDSLKDVGPNVKIEDLSHEQLIVYAKAATQAALVYRDLFSLLYQDTFQDEFDSENLN
jgi:hypothetical protein